MQHPSTRIVTDYLMTIHAPLDPAQVVATDLHIYNVRPGGWVKGPAIQGEVIAPGADWLRVMPNGTHKLDVRMSIRADDGSIIYVSYGGRIVVPDGSAARAAAGAVLGPDDLYFVTTPIFETASTKYGWLNDIVAVGKIAATKEGEGGFVTYDIFAVK
ncbi:MAG: DUF3237 domain-containing protein [Alphaproteobacteria bacterium]